MGTARFTMRNWDDEHGEWLYTYEFVGFDSREQHKIRGIHHVNPSQCTVAWWSWFSGTPATIARLHNDQVSILQCIIGGGGGGEVENRIPAAYRAEEVSRPTECGGSGGSGGGSTVVCYTIITDHYWYYPDTGDYEYRYSTSETYCEMT
jgi:hypothetical protein